MDRTKTWTIKNSVYANIQVPQTWKSKLSYQQELLKIISEDTNFFNYLSKGNSSKHSEKEKKYHPSQHDRNNIPVNNPEHQNSNLLNKNHKYNIGSNNNNHQNSQNNILNTNVSYIRNSSREEKDITPVNGTSNSNIHKNQKHHNSSISHNAMIEDSREITDSPKLTKGFPSISSKKKASSLGIRLARNFTEKEKREILDHYKDTFQLSKKQDKTDPLNNDTQLSLSRDGSLLPNIHKIKDENHPNHMDGLDSSLKGQMFKSSIYSLLLPTKINASNNTSLLKDSTVNSSTSNLRSKSNNGSKLKTSTNEGLFLNFNYEEFNKKVEIKNPEVKRVLEDINYYGPYFSHCPSCRNKNLEFYQTLEPHACLNILNFLKKTRKKPKYLKEQKTTETRYKD